MNSKNQSKNLFHLPFRFKMRIPFILASFILLGHTLFAGESPYLYGIFDPEATEYLNHISSGAGPGWVTATVQVAIVEDWNRLVAASIAVGAAVAAYAAEIRAPLSRRRALLRDESEKALSP